MSKRGRYFSAENHSLKPSSENHCTQHLVGVFWYLCRE